MRRETELAEQARTRAEAEEPAAKGQPQGATMKGGIIKGRVPFRPDLHPAWLDALFPEGEATTTTTGEVLTA